MIECRRQMIELRDTASDVHVCEGIVPMTGEPQCRWFIHSVLLVTALLLVAGCSGVRRSTLEQPNKTTSTIEIKEDQPVFVSKALGDRLKSDMTVQQALSALEAAAQDQPLVKSNLEALVPKDTVKQRYELTITQGKRKLKLIFVENKLREKPYAEYE